MDFKEATDFLFAGVDHEHLAQELGVSVASIRQARLMATANAHRSPPPNWEEAVLKLANNQMRRYQLLVDRLNVPTSGGDSALPHKGDKMKFANKNVSH